MHNSIFGIPILITSFTTYPHVWTLPVKAVHDNGENAIDADTFLKYTLPIKTNPAEFILNKLSTISLLQENWDGHEATVPDFSVIHNSRAFLRNLPEPIISELKQDDLTATPYGTIVFDFNYNKEAVSVEIGEKKIGFYSEFIDGSDFNLDSKLFNQDGLPIELTKAFEKLYKTVTLSRNSLSNR